MITKNIDIKLESEAGARPIAMLVQVASKYKSKINIQQADRTVNAKSIMGIMAFNPSEGMSVDIVTEGSDEQEALIAIEKFLVCE